MRTTLTAALLALASLPAADAAACSCVRPPPAREAVERADAVFEGRVLSDRTEGSRRYVTLEVVQYWKGVDTERVEVVTGQSSAACGVSFEPETSWLVYAEASDSGLVASLCSRTRRIEEAQNDLEVLQAGVVPVEVGPEDEVEEPAPAAEPSRAGCASCAVGAGGGSEVAGAPVLALLGLLLVRRRR